MTNSQTRVTDRVPILHAVRGCSRIKYSQNNERWFLNSSMNAARR